MNHNRKSLVGFAVASAIAFASVAVAQHEGRPRGGGHGPRGEGMGQLGQLGQLRILRELDLTEDQRQQIRTLFEEVEASGVPDRLREARESLHDAIESGADESTLRQQASQLGEVEGDAAVEWARARTRIQEMLTPEQKKELEQLKREAEERMEMFRRQREERKARKSKSGADPL